MHFSLALCSALLLSPLLVTPVLSTQTTKTETIKPSITPKKAIEQFMKLTALYLIELQWNDGYNNRIPNQAARAKAMLAGNISDCPQDFQEAWLRQVQNPRRNYSAPILRKYGITLAPLRKELQEALYAFDSSVRVPVPLYDEEEAPPKFDPMTCGKRQNILNAVTKLKWQLSGINPNQIPLLQQEIRKVMLAFTLHYLEAMVCLQYHQLSAADVTMMFQGIDVSRCPADFRKAWQHDLPYFLNGQFTRPDLQVQPVALRYGIDEAEIIQFVRKKMKEWEIDNPTTKKKLPSFRKDLNDLKVNILS